MESIFGTIIARDFTLNYGKYFWHTSCKGHFENDYHYRFGSPYVKKISLKEIWIIEKFWGDKSVLGGVALLSYRCECFGMVLALIHPRLSKVFTTLINTPQKLIFIKFISSVL